MPRLAVAQMQCAVGNVAANVARGADLIAEAAAQGANVVCLPECFNTCLAGGSLAELAEDIPGPTSETLCQAAYDGQLWVAAGMVEKGPEKPYNTALVISPEGQVVARYHKCYLYLSEVEVFARGHAACLVDLGFARAGVTICYDYIFPEYIRDLVVRGAQLILHSTAWVDTEDCRKWHYPAVEAYRAQNRVRALENGVFFMSANHHGPYDPEGYLVGVGHSSIIAPWGEVLAEIETGEGVAVAEVKFEEAAKWAATAAPYLQDHLHVPRPM